MLVSLEALYDLLTPTYSILMPRHTFALAVSDFNNTSMSRGGKTAVEKRGSMYINYGDLQ